MLFKRSTYKYPMVFLLGVFSCGGLEEVPLSDSEILASDLNIINTWLENKGLTDSVIVTSSKLRYIPTVVGTGLKLDSGDVVQVGYVGRFFDDRIFGQSTEGSPLSFALHSGQVIRGFNEGVDSMRVGSKYKLLIPSHLAYGRQGSGPIDPNTPVYFDIEVLANPEEQIILDWIEESEYADQIITLPNGLRYLIFHDEASDNIKVTNKVTLEYEGRLLKTNKVFDSSFTKEGPFEFVLKDNNLIWGWELGVQYLSEGDSAMLVIPSKLGYGQNTQGSIPANSPLIFRLKVEKVE